MARFHAALRCREELFMLHKDCMSTGENLHFPYIVRIRYAGLLVHRIIINWLYLDLILHQQPALLLDLFHQAYMSSDKQQVPC